VSVGRLAAAAGLLLGCACGAATESPTASGSGSTRPYRLAQTGAQIMPTRGVVYTPADLASDADVVAVHQDFFGVPWQAFETRTEPPRQWAALMDSLQAQAAATGKDVFLSLALVDGGLGRQFLAARAEVVAGELRTVVGWSERCYDFATAADGPAKKAAYARYVDYMVRKFRPRYVNVAIEMNLFLTCEAGWDGLVEAERDAYDAAKAARPDAIVFPSIQIDQLYGYIPEGACRSQPALCYEENYARLLRLKRDRFAVSTYPYSVPEIANIDRIPADWFTRAASRLGERVVVAETGWISEPPAILFGGTCVRPFVSPDLTEDGERRYLARLLREAETSRMDLVTYFSNRDLVPAALMSNCPCTFDRDWCALVELLRRQGTTPREQAEAEMLLKAFGTMGIRRYDGSPKGAVFTRWQEARALPVSPLP